MLVFLAGTGNNYEFISKGTCRVTVAGIFHLISAYNSVRLILDHNFIALIQAVGHFIEVTTTYQEKTPCWSLHTLEVMREIGVKVNLTLLESLSLKDIFMDEFGVSFEDKQALDELHVLYSIRLYSDLVVFFDFEPPLTLGPALVALEPLVRHDS